MALGSALFLIALGAILTFAVHATVSGISIQMVGIILMCVGAAGVLLDLAMFAPRRRGHSTSGEVTTTGPDGLPRTTRYSEQASAGPGVV